MKAFKLLLCLVALTTACKKAAVSNVQSLAFNPGARNVALVFGAPRDLKGIDIDVREAENLLRSQPFRFEVHSKLYATRSDIINMTREHSRDVSADGTLAIVFSGHGAKDGAWAAEDGMVAFSEIASEIRGTSCSINTTRDSCSRQSSCRWNDSSQRCDGTAELKRLVVIVDACYSGQMADAGNNSILLTEVADKGDDGAEVETYEDELETLVDEVLEAVDPSFDLQGGASLADEEQDKAIPRIASQTFVIASSTRDQTSGATAQGSLFIQAFIKRIQAASDRETFQQIADATAADVRARKPTQTPIYKALPTSLLTEPVKGSNQAPSNSGNPPLTPVPTPSIQPQSPSGPRPTLAPPNFPQSTPTPSTGGACRCGLYENNTKCAVTNGTQVLAWAARPTWDADCSQLCNPQTGIFKDQLTGTQCRSGTGTGTGNIGTNNTNTTSACQCKYQNGVCMVVRGTVTLASSPEGDQQACLQYACNPTGGRFRDVINGPQCR